MIGETKMGRRGEDGVDGQQEDRILDIQGGQESYTVVLLGKNLPG